ncbi:MAG: chorismate mutase [Terriglobales bacterium]
MDIAELRRRIDELDQQIVALLNERCRCALAIGEHKRRQGLEAEDPEREAAVRANAAAANRSGGAVLSPAALDRIFTCIVEEMRAAQK